mmetsp:Transcript_14786/g.40856  ORF Transcript_14786/g.40856 Transcript_14786/m.40856 type:complete len:90 (+) Transcript_14786:259-528(+)
MVNDAELLWVVCRLTTAFKPESSNASFAECGLMADFVSWSLQKQCICKHRGVLECDSFHGLVAVNRQLHYRRITAVQAVPAATEMSCPR